MVGYILELKKTGQALVQYSSSSLDEEEGDDKFWLLGMLADQLRLGEVERETCGKNSKGGDDFYFDDNYYDGYYYGNILTILTIFTILDNFDNFNITYFYNINNF